MIRRFEALVFILDRSVAGVVDVFARRDAIGTDEIFAHDGFGGNVTVRIRDLGSVNFIH
jgi:hypothetical protein